MKYLVLFLFMATCNEATTNGSSASFDKKTICQVWVHSHEESNDDMIAYRPESYNFPPSRGRTKMEIRQNGTLSNWVIAPACGLLERKAKWNVDGETVIVTYDKAEEGLPTKVNYKVVEVTPEILKLQAI